MERIPDHIKALVKGLPGVRLDYGRVDSTLRSCGGSHPLGEDVPIIILEAEISRPEGERGYVVLAEKIPLDGEFSLVIKDPVGSRWVFATPRFGELTGLTPDVVCGASGEFRRSLLEKIYIVADAQSSPHHRGINLIPTVAPTITSLPFP